MKREASVFALAAFILSGCATTSTSVEPVRKDSSGACDAAGVQEMVGQTATAEIGAELLAKSGADVLRWAPPRSAMTMDYRPDRLTVSYDDNMVIERISCG